MKKILTLNAIFLLAVFSSIAQPFQQSFTNSFGYSCDHYSIETAEVSDYYTYACAGTFFNGSQTIMHLFTIDNFGAIVWENYVNLGTTDGRVLDVAIGRESQVAITGFVDNGSGPELYAALYDGLGNLINDFQYSTGNNTTGNNIIYSAINDQFIIGGFESVGLTLVGNALLIALDGGFNYQWTTNYSALCDGFNMSTINDIVDVNGNYFITGNLSNANPPYPNGQSQVLAAMVDNANGSILDNESFVATNTLGGQHAMGVSAYYDRSEEILVLMYNVSISPTVDENRPYIATFKVIGSDLFFGFGHRIDDTFASNPSSFISNPSFTGLKILPNRGNNSYVIFGMLEAYGEFNDMVLSVYQEVDLSGTILTPAKFWTPSEIPNAYPTGYPSQGGFYSFFNALTLNTDVYTPESTTLNVDGERFVSILPTDAGSYSFDIISSVLTTSNAISPCLEEFEMEMVPQSIFAPLCLVADPTGGTVSSPLNSPSSFTSSQLTSCVIDMKPALGNDEIEFKNPTVNQLTLFSNPAHDVLQFSVTEIGTYNLIVMNTDGRIVINNEFNNTKNQNLINISDLANGVYIITVINQNGEAIKKLFVKE